MHGQPAIFSCNSWSHGAWGSNFAMDIRVRPWMAEDVPSVTSLLHEVLAPLARSHATVARHSRKRIQREIPRGSPTIRRCPCAMQCAPCLPYRKMVLSFVFKMHRLLLEVLLQSPLANCFRLLCTWPRPPMRKSLGVWRFAGDIAILSVHG